MDIRPELPHPGVLAGDIGAFGIIITTIMSILPPIAAILGLLWYAIQIYESKTVQAWIHNHNIKVRAKRLAKLQAKALIVRAEIDALEKVRIAKAYAIEKVLEAKADAASGLKLQQTADKIDAISAQTDPKV